MTAAGATCGLTLHLTAGNDIFPSENTSVKAFDWPDSQGEVCGGGAGCGASGAAGAAGALNARLADGGVPSPQRPPKGACFTANPAAPWSLGHAFVALRADASQLMRNFA